MIAEPFIAGIPLQNGQIAICDVQDYEMLSQYTWSLGSDGYVSAKIDGKTVRMHTLLMGKWIDHRSRDKRDNRRCNLRTANQQQNVANASLSRRNTTGYRGVHMTMRSGKPYRARITIDGKQKTIGYYASAIEAAAAYNAAALAAFGEFAYHNHI